MFISKDSPIFVEVSCTTKVLWIRENRFFIFQNFFNLGIDVFPFEIYFFLFLSNFPIYFILNCFFQSYSLGITLIINNFLIFLKNFWKVFELIHLSMFLRCSCKLAKELFYASFLLNFFLSAIAQHSHKTFCQSFLFFQYFSKSLSRTVNWKIENRFPFFLKKDLAILIFF